MEERSEEPSWLFAVQRFLHGFPRFSVYTFQKVSAKFEPEPIYFESVINYGLMFIALLLLSILLIIGSVFFTHLNLTEHTTRSVFVYKTILFVCAFLSFLSSIMAFVGLAVINNSIRSVIKNQLDPAIAIIKVFYGHVVSALDKAFGTLRGARDHLSAPVDSMSFFDVVKRMTISTIALPLINDFLKYEVYATKIKKVIEEMLEMFETVKKIAQHGVSLIMLYVLFTMIISLWMAACSLGRKGTGPIVCRIAIVVLVSWWLVGALVVPILLFMSDTCYHPVRVIAKIANFIHPGIDENIIYYYGDCIEPNPLELYIHLVFTILNYVITSLGPIIWIVQFLDPDGSTLESLKKTQKYIWYIMIEGGGCRWSANATKTGFNNICSNVIMGFGAFTLAAFLIPLSLTFAVIACLRLRNFKGWPKKQGRTYPCPSTCHVHREFKIPPRPCRPKPIRSQIIFPKPKVYDRRITCPITCRGHDRVNALPNLRSVCPPKCRGRLPPKPPKKQKPPKPVHMKYIKQKADKTALCCIELYENTKCRQDTATCLCDTPDPKAKCGQEICNVKGKSKLLYKCGLNKCRFTKRVRRTRRRPQKKKPTPAKPADKPADPMKKASKCGIDKCNINKEAKSNLVNCGIVRCKKFLKMIKLQGDTEMTVINPMENPAEPAISQNFPVSNVPQEQNRNTTCPTACRGHVNKNNPHVYCAPNTAQQNQGPQDAVNVKTAKKKQKKK